MDAGVHGNRRAVALREVGRRAPPGCSRPRQRGFRASSGPVLLVAASGCTDATGAATARVTGSNSAPRRPGPSHSGRSRRSRWERLARSLAAGREPSVMPPMTAMTKTSGLCRVLSANRLRRLVRRLPLHPALHACVLADGNVETHPRRPLEMRTEHCARREHDAFALRFFCQRQ